jgi:hypothetical protein
MKCSVCEGKNSEQGLDELRPVCTSCRIDARSWQSGNKQSQMRDEYLKYILEARGVETPCSHCSGLGVMAYPDTSTWHHRIGGQSITSDVCEFCWGSGDANRKGADLRAIEAEFAKVRAWATSEKFEYVRDGCSQMRRAKKEVLALLRDTGKGKTCPSPPEKK